MGNIILIISFWIFVWVALQDLDDLATTLMTNGFSGTIVFTPARAS